MKMKVVIAPLAICASVFAAAADQPDDQQDNRGTLAVAESEKAAELHQVSKTHSPEEHSGPNSAQDAAPAEDERAAFSGRGLTQQEKRIFVLGLEAQEKK